MAWPYLVWPSLSWSVLLNFVQISGQFSMTGELVLAYPIGQSIQRCAMCGQKPENKMRPLKQRRRREEEKKSRTL